MLNTAARELLAAIVDSSDDGIVSMTLSGTITSWNRGAERMFGYSATETVGRSILMLLPPDRTDEEAHFLSETAAGRRVEHFETVRVRKDGGRIHVSVTLSPIRNADGRITGVSKIVRDISDRVSLQDRADSDAQRLNLALEAARLGDWSWDVTTDRGDILPAGRRDLCRSVPSIPDMDRDARAAPSGGSRPRTHRAGLQCRHAHRGG